MLLVVDIGNTNITFGVFEAENLVSAFRIRTILEKTSDEYFVLVDALLRRKGIEPGQIDALALASVVPPLSPVFVEFSQDCLGVEPLVVGAGIKTGIAVRYEDPKEVGADRIVDAAAVKALYRTPACIVDFGTATTFDALSREGEYLGGAIAPGIQIAAQALFSKTSKLPKVELTAPPKVVGRNTAHSIQSGLVYGYASLVEGMVDRIKQEIGQDALILGTGGLAQLMNQHTKIFEVVDPWLTLKGLRILHDMNQKRGK